METGLVLTRDKIENTRHLAWQFASFQKISYFQLVAQEKKIKNLSNAMISKKIPGETFQISMYTDVMLAAVSMRKTSTFFVAWVQEDIWVQSRVLV